MDGLFRLLFYNRNIPEPGRSSAIPRAEAAERRSCRGVIAGSEAGTDAPLGWLKEVFSTSPASQIETEFDRIDVIAPKGP